MTNSIPSPSDSPGILFQQPELFQIAQSLYNVVTGKTEKLSRAYTSDFKIEKDDLDQLHRKCTQMCSQWTTLGTNSSITLHHVDDNKETFSSYERFNIYDSSRTSPIESVTYEFHVLIRRDSSPKPEPYKLTIRALSRLAAERRFAQAMPPGPLVKLFMGGPIIAEIEYVDYVIARSILTTIDSWVNEIERAKDGLLVNFWQNHSHWFPRIALILAPIGAVFASVYAAPNVLGPTFDHILFTQFIVVSVGGVWLAGHLGKTFSQIVEQGVDSLIPLSYIKLNKGDEKLLESHESRKKYSIIRILFGIISLIIEGVCITFFSENFLEWIIK